MSLVVLNYLVFTIALSCKSHKTGKINKIFAAN